ncbi:cyclopropane fatty acyl phospholipid synthase [Uliginosibacterium gangwonense]|uniref:cyclopropane fatty acyl phospholipid synthase n=1 Tax=Uliginosibacterium gangwonense TaxID=392736 RepID=UPI000360D978|nr:cyclopropane fatty acyl phospholipid synthase [Uliginosibacterium gangwonense]
MHLEERTLSRNEAGCEAADAPRILEQLLEYADIRFNGTRPWDIQVHRPDVYRRILTHWSLGFGESYIDGGWDCAQLDEMFTRLLAADLDERVVGSARWRLAFAVLRHSFLNLQSRQRAFQVGERHYDAGNDVFESMLDSRMIYSCGYWTQADDLESAQAAKLDLICRKLQLQPGETLLDIGCGWGGLAAFAAEHYGVQVTGITVSKEQLALASERCKGLPVQFLLQDYRALQGRFDKIVSVGMFEHVGPKNYGVYFDTVRRLLKPEGLFLLHTIGSHITTSTTDAWIDRYVFPNGKIPSAAEIGHMIEGRFLIEDWHNFGADYDRTLMAWIAKFEHNWPTLAPRYGERFRRMWLYYLKCSAGFFRSRQGQLWQLVLGGRERKDIYRSVR